MNQSRPIFALLLGLGISVPAVASDWDQWRGPNRDGQIVGYKSPKIWPKTLVRSWKVEVGEGHSSPLLIGHSVFTFTRQGDDEVARCLDLKDGRQIWRDSYPAPFDIYPGATGHGKGPKGTAVYRDGRLFTLGIGGVLSGLDARTGKVLWRHDFLGAHKRASPIVGTAMSPIVEHGMVIAHVGTGGDGELTAFDVKSGEVRWRWSGDGPAYASPITITREGVRQIVTQTEKMCVGIEAKSGNLLWSLPFKSLMSQNAVTPAIAGDLIIFAGLGQATFACRIGKLDGLWKAEKVWESRDEMMYMSTPVVSGGKIYGPGQARFCPSEAWS